ncbi:histidinol-phosphatase [Vallitalea longa]|uniref:Histidinol-phosphatase n=1 Tax=Vallitalea longa TaxID=2936439 RepID=A0A9W5YBC3_9FIRM|nr:PHP domain-containing protein [Vallitalea longa]GKX29243.1 histidinol-phosphatase [Vallitalea longa]
MKIDLHVHAKERSACSIASEKEHIESAIRFGLDGLVFTDHNKISSEEHIADLNKKYSPFRIYSGIEITIKDKGEDILVIGINDSILEEKNWSYEELYTYVKKNSGFIALAHPYRYKDHVNVDIENYIPDAIEIHSTNIGKDDEQNIKKLAKKLKTRLINNSDGHDSRHVGIYYNELNYTPKDNAELVEILKTGKYKYSSSIYRIKMFNEEVRKKEEIIRKLIKEGKDREFYRKLTGNWEGEFDRVAMGKSYEI